MMDIELIEIDSMIALRDSIDALTGHRFSVRDGTGRLLVPSEVEDPLSVIAKDEYDDFVKKCIAKAILRKGASVFLGPMNQHQHFIPAQAGETWFVLVGNSFYSSMRGLDEFFTSKGANPGIPAGAWKRRAETMVVPNTGRLVEMCDHIGRLLRLFVKNIYEKNLNRQRYVKTRTIIDVFSDLARDVRRENIYDLLCETIIFLFGVETVSIMARDDNSFIPMFTIGRLKDRIEIVPLATSIPFVEEAARKGRPCICAETASLLRLGYSNDIISVHLFPVPLKKEGPLLLSVFNVRLTEENVDSILKLCTFAAFVLEGIETREEDVKHAKNLAAIDLACRNIISFKEPDELYEAIVDVSSRYMEAEKASLMLPNENSQELFIKVSKGMNKQIARNITVRFGEGIAGNVYKEGRPLIVSDIEKSLSVRKRPHFRTGSFVSLPLRIGNETIGVLNLADKLRGVFSEADMEFLGPFTSCASFAIKGAHYYQMSEQMKELSITDYLTGLFNRRYFDARFTEELQRASRYESVLSLVIVDIDNFKLFNDTEGHLAGDEVLKSMAGISRESLRSFDIMARFGGEEFAIIMPETDGKEAFLVAERMRTNIKGSVGTNWKNFPFKEITVSAGIATFPLNGMDAGTLIRRADRALYIAKISGKDRVVQWGTA